MLIIYDCETGSVTEKKSKKLLSYLERRYKLNMDNLKKKMNIPIILLFLFHNKKLCKKCQYFVIISGLRYTT